VASTRSPSPQSSMISSLGFKAGAGNARQDLFLYR
jgi:hypothetical protein